MQARGKRVGIDCPAPAGDVARRGQISFFHHNTRGRGRLAPFARRCGLSSAHGSRGSAAHPARFRSRRARRRKTRLERPARFDYRSRPKFATESCHGSRVARRCCRAHWHRSNASPTEGQNMRRGFLLLAVLLLGGGGWWFFQHYQIVGLEHISVRPRAASHAEPGADESLPPPVDHASGTLRIASFNIQVFGAAKLDKPARDERPGRRRPPVRRGGDSGSPGQDRRHPAPLRRPDQLDRPPLRLSHRPATGPLQQQRAIRVHLRHRQHRSRSIGALHRCRSRRPAPSRTAGGLVSCPRAAPSIRPSPSR